MWVFNIGFSSVSAVSTSCLKCEKVLLTLQLVDHQVQALPDANNIGALLQGKKMPPEAQDLRIIASNYIISFRKRLQNFLGINVKNKTFHRTKREIGFKAGKFRMNMFGNSKFKVPRAVLYSIPAVVALIMFLCCLTFFCDVPHQWQMKWNRRQFIIIYHCFWKQRRSLYMIHIRSDTLLKPGVTDWIRWTSAWEMFHMEQHGKKQIRHAEQNTKVVGNSRTGPLASIQSHKLIYPASYTVHSPKMLPHPLNPPSTLFYVQDSSICSSCISNQPLLLYY